MDDRPAPPTEVRAGAGAGPSVVDPRVAGTGRAATLAVAVGAGAAVALASVALVALRWPDPLPAGGPLASVDAALDRSLIADRVLSLVGWFEYVATLGVVGGMVFRTFVRCPGTSGRGTAEGMLVLAALGGIAACTAKLPLRAMVISGRGPAAAGDLDVLRVVLTSRFGDGVCLRVLALGLFVLVLLRPPPGWERRVKVIRPAGTLLLFGSVSRRTVERAACTVVVLVAVASFTLVGHPQASEPRGLLLLAQSVHVLAAAVWFGGGVLLAVDIHRRRRGDDARGAAETVARFSRVAGAAVALVGTTGVVLAGSQLSSVGGLVATPYGRALSAKLVAVGVVAALGAYNHVRLVPAVVGRDDVGAWRLLGRTAALEGAVIASAVLVATAAMTSGGF